MPIGDSLTSLQIKQSEKFKTIQNSPECRPTQSFVATAEAHSDTEAVQVFNSPFPLYCHFQMYSAAKVYWSSFTSFGLKLIPPILWVLRVYHIKSHELVQVCPTANLPAVYPSLQLQEVPQKKPPIQSGTVTKR